MDFSAVFATALTFFLITNPIGNSPAIIALIKDFSFDRQKKILIRESLLALILALFFQFFGALFLGLINVEGFAVTLCGGVLLFIVALDMIFPHHETTAKKKGKAEPYLVPIATPLLAGPALLTIIMLYTQQQSPVVITTAIIISSLTVMGVLVVTPYLTRLMGKRGLTALEQLMGLILSMMAMQMIVKGIALFINT